MAVFPDYDTQHGAAAEVRQWRRSSRSSWLGLRGFTWFMVAALISRQPVTDVLLVKPKQELHAVFSETL
jgi:hypothetical protein